MEPLYAVFPGTALDGPVFRVVGENPPTEVDFLSYEYAGRAYPAREFFRATGVSMHLTRKAAERAKRQWGLGDYIAELDVTGQEWILWAKTGGPDHISVWAPPPVLLHCVVNCR